MRFRLLSVITALVGTASSAVQGQYALKRPTPDPEPTQLLAVSPGVAGVRDSELAGRTFLTAEVSYFFGQRSGDIFPVFMGPGVYGEAILDLSESAGGFSVGPSFFSTIAGIDGGYLYDGARASHGFQVRPHVTLAILTVDFRVGVTFGGRGSTMVGAGLRLNFYPLGFGDPRN